MLERQTLVLVFGDARVRVPHHIVPIVAMQRKFSTVHTSLNSARHLMSVSPGVLRHS